MPPLLNWSTITRLSRVLHFLNMGHVKLTFFFVMASMIFAEAENPRPRVDCPVEDTKFGDTFSDIQGVASWEDCGM